LISDVFAILPWDYLALLLGYLCYLGLADLLLYRIAFFKWHQRADRLQFWHAGLLRDSDLHRLAKCVLNLGTLLSC